MKIQVGGKTIGGDAPCFIIAEVGINHNNDMSVAKGLIDAAADAGCNAVKFQAFKAERMYPRSAGKLDWKDGEKEYSYDIFEANKSFELPDDWWPELRDYAKSKGLVFFSSVFDERAVDMFEKYFDVLKAASYSITHTPLLKHMAGKGKPMIFSTGTATIDEVKEAYDVIKDLNKNIVVLHCVAEYPMPLGRANILTIDVLKEMFPDAVVGFSDHSIEDSDAAVAAIAHGAKVIEKHITLDRKMKGPDHFFALEPEMLKQMVGAIREAERELADGRDIAVDLRLIGERERELSEGEKYIKSFCGRGVMTTRAMKKGEVLTEKNIAVLRHGKKERGLHPKWYEKILSGRYALTRDVELEHPLQEGDIGEVKPRVVAIIQARMGSTRLPGKVLMKIRGRPLLELLVRRLRLAKELNNIVIATSEAEGNEKVVELAKKLGVDYFVGSEDDVLGRVFDAAIKFGADVVVRITGDEPLIGPKIVDSAVRSHLNKKAEYTGTTLNRTFPKGVDVEVLSFGCLNRLDRLAGSVRDREHVTSYVHSHKSEFRINSFEAWTDKLRSKYVITVDDAQDFELASEIFNHFGDDMFYTEDVVEFLDKVVSEEGGIKRLIKYRE